MFIALLDALGLRTADDPAGSPRDLRARIWWWRSASWCSGRCCRAWSAALVFSYLSNIGSAAAAPIGALARYALLVFVVFMAAEQLAIRTEVLVSAFQIAFAALCSPPRWRSGSAAATGLKK